MAIQVMGYEAQTVALAGLVPAREDVHPVPGTRLGVAGFFR